MASLLQRFNILEEILKPSLYLVSDLIFQYLTRRDLAALQQAMSKNLLKSSPFQLRINQGVFWLDKVIKPSIMALERSEKFQKYVIEIWEKIVQAIDSHNFSLNLNFCNTLSKTLMASMSELGYDHVEVEMLEFPLTCFLTDLDESLPIFILLQIHLTRPAMQKFADSYTVESGVHFAAKMGNLNVFKIFTPYFQYKNQFCHILPDYHLMSVFDTAYTYQSEAIMKEIMNPPNHYLKKKYDIMYATV